MRVLVLAESCGSQCIDPSRTHSHDDGGRCAGCCKYALPAFHLAVISIAPVAVRPKRSGRYMSSTMACGSISPRRHRTHNIGNCKDRRCVRHPVEGCGEAVVAEFGAPARRCPQSSRGRRLAGGDRARIIDFESGRQESATMTRPNCGCAGHLQHHDKALVLPCFARVGRFPASVW
jgi:hypothetical protein